MAHVAAFRDYSELIMKSAGPPTSTDGSTNSLRSLPQGASTPSSAGTSGSTPAVAMPPVHALPSLVGTGLERVFHLLAFGGKCGLHWNHYTAQTIQSSKPASVLMFNKKSNVKAPARIGRINRLALVDLLKYGSSQLSALSHPRLLKCLGPLTESKDVICLLIEPILGSLDTFLEIYTLERLEIKLGILQLIDGLSYLHNSAKILHGNLNPQSIYVSCSQQWKIGGFRFSVPAKKEDLFPCYSWSKKLPPELQPDLDFLAPEYLAPNNNHVTTSADVFSLGVLICWIYSGGTKIIDARNNTDSYTIVVDQLDAALEVISDKLGPNLKESLLKVLSKEVDQRPQVQMLALTKHFDDSALTAMRQLDDIAQEFDPTHKSHFLSQTLVAALPDIPEKIWFTRIMARFTENLYDSPETFTALLRPLTCMLSHCESHNIHKLRPWFRHILENVTNDVALTQAVFDNISTIFRRLNDEMVEDKCLEIILNLLRCEDNHLKQSALRAIPHIAEYVPLWYINKKLVPIFNEMSAFFDNHVPRQIDLLVAIAHLSDRCDSLTMYNLLSVASICTKHHPAIVHSKSRLVQRIITCDVGRLKDTNVITTHLLTPLASGLALPELSSAHFDDVMSSVRILLDIIEQIRYESDDHKMRPSDGGRLCSRRVSMSSNHLPRLLITAARPSFSGDGRKMSFLSADGRLEDPRRRESKDSRGSIESDVSLKIGNGSDVSDESQVMSSTGTETRRKSWLEGYMHTVSLEQSSQLDVGLNTVRKQRQSERRSRTRSPTNEASDARPARPNSFTNLGHNLACTLWKTFY
ncbi:unnamed protein product [Bursaphelenchus okinawaensis]|uniref:Protein kinase domain-containing protein n=1 Tax=Bursaphelenchus okinawaensis TaxID=465554 RepID=A0A811JTZ2_9BILA|nr:unnamed protein product [Bursaphelenchus okinawaensis]CAG9083068.1 unnamed protein product [Bursaphelenchus okinawaensis]